MSDAYVTRVTLFKIPKVEDQQELVGFYGRLLADQKKDGKPYILSLEAGPVGADERSQGFTFVSKTVFKNKEDFDFYDTACEAHKALKVKAKNLTVEGMMMVYFTPTVSHKI